MIEIREILCPIDFSDTSRHALEHATAIAAWYESRLTALHVLEPPFPQPPILFAQFPSTVPSAVDRRACAGELTAWLEPAIRAGVATDALVEEGVAAARILEQASVRKADLIVMGTHGISGFERFLLGSVAEKVLRKADCPVMTVPPTAHTAAKVPYTRLLCAVDFSESSLAALRFAFSIAEESDAKLTLLHVVEWPHDEIIVQQVNVPEFRRLVEQDARDRLEALVTDDVRVWCKPSTKLAHGKAYVQILAAAENEETDLIVIGVSGRNPIDVTLFGSTTNHVVRRASCPVLTMKH